jgi:hypothetical protein
LHPRYHEIGLIANFWSVQPKFLPIEASSKNQMSVEAVEAREDEILGCSNDINED